MRNEAEIKNHLHEAEQDLADMEIDDPARPELEGWIQGVKWCLEGDE